MRSFVTTSAGTVSLLLLANLASAAELLGCDAVNCTRDSYGTGTQCKVGNSTLGALGITNFTSTLSTSPLTWTFGYTENGTRADNTSLRLFDRNFYLGTPPSLSWPADTTGCALFFEGYSPRIRKPIGEKTDKYSCADVLNESCVNDVIAQAKAEGKGGNGTAEEVCRELGKVVAEKPPKSCSFLTDGSWGGVVARPLTGDSAPKPETLDSCKPTTGRDYNVSLVLSNRKESAGGVENLMPVIGSVAPILTFFRKGQDTEAYMSCVGMVETKRGSVSDSSGGAAGQEGTAGIVAPVFSYLGLVAVAVAILL